MAATASNTLSVTADVASSCAVTTTPVAFAGVDVTTDTNLSAQGGFDVTCTSGTTWAAAADKGAGTTATITTRELSDGTNTLTYSLYTDSSHTTLWGDGTTGQTIGGTGTGTAQANPVYGLITAGQTGVPAGSSFTDTVNITVTY